MLIFEGSDNLGKSTAAKTAVRMALEMDSHPTMYAHMTRPNGSFDFFKGYKSFISPYVVQDRFHLGALAYHEAVMTRAHLRIIEGMIFSAGGIVVNIYCSDYRQYEKRIKNDTRGNILTEQLMCEANQRFHVMALGRGSFKPRIDFNVDISQEPSGFISDETLKSIVEEWIDVRVEALKVWNT